MNMNAGTRSWLLIFPPVPNIIKVNNCFKSCPIKHFKMIWSVSFSYWNKTNLTGEAWMFNNAVIKKKKQSDIFSFFIIQVGAEKISDQPTSKNLTNKITFFFFINLFHQKWPDLLPYWAAINLWSLAGGRSCSYTWAQAKKLPSPSNQCYTDVNIPLIPSLWCNEGGAPTGNCILRQGTHNNIFHRQRHKRAALSLKIDTFER